MRFLILAELLFYAADPREFVVEDKTTPKFAVTVKTTPCACGTFCRCDPGSCPGGCLPPTPAAVPTFPQVKVCEGGKCRILMPDPSFSPPGFGRPPAGMFWYKTADGRWALHYIPTK